MVDGKQFVRFADTIPMSTYLVAFIVGELEATRAVSVGATPLRVWCVPGKHRLTAFGRAIGAFSLRLLRGLLRPPLSRRQARPDRHPRLRGRGDGEPRRHHLPRDGPAGRRGRRHARRARAHRRRGGPRKRPHVVRRPGDDVVVERPVAERGVRHLHGDARRRRLEAGVAALDDVRRVALGGPGHGRPAQHAAHRVPRRRAARRRRHVRRADLRKGSVGAAHAGAVPRPGGLPRGRAQSTSDDTPTAARRRPTCGTRWPRPPPSTSRP